MKVTTDSCFFGAWAAEEIKNAGASIKNILDIGAGTGLLSLMIAQKNDAKIDAVEIDAEAAAQAIENIENSPWKDRISIFAEDIISFPLTKQYDCIVCNPPFYERELTSSEGKRNIAHHSEQLTISQVLNIIASHLKPDGIFFLMYPFKRREEVEGLIKQHKLHIATSVILQQSVQHSPFRVIIMGKKERTDKNTLTIPIMDEYRHYTKPFVELLKDYYLYL